jgi:hypothetical protein
METVMKKLILAAALIAPFAAAPAFADEASGFIETAAVTTYAANQPREFTARHGHAAGAVSAAEQSLIQREAVPSSAFGSVN